MPALPATAVLQEEISSDDGGEGDECDAAPADEKEAELDDNIKAEQHEQQAEQATTAVSGADAGADAGAGAGADANADGHADANADAAGDTGIALPSTDDAVQAEPQQQHPGADETSVRYGELQLRKNSVE